MYFYECVAHVTGNSTNSPVQLYKHLYTLIDKNVVILIILLSLFKYTEASANNTEEIIHSTPSSNLTTFLTDSTTMLPSSSPNKLSSKCDDWTSRGSTDVTSEEMEMCCSSLGLVNINGTEAADAYRSFLQLFSKYECGNEKRSMTDSERDGDILSYSHISSCNHCEEKYKRWICSTATGSVFLYKGSSIRPCSSVCLAARRNCPYIHPDASDSYSSEPGFICPEEEDVYPCYFFKDSQYHDNQELSNVYCNSTETDHEICIRSLSNQPVYSLSLLLTSLFFLFFIQYHPFPSLPS